MKTVLVFPPPADPSHPPLGIAALAGHLRMLGHQVDLADLNVQVYAHVLRSDTLAESIRHVQDRVRELELSHVLQASDREEYLIAAERLLSAGYLLDRVDDVTARLQDPGLYFHRTAWREAASVVRRALA